MAEALFIIILNSRHGDRMTPSIVQILNSLSASGYRRSYMSRGMKLKMVWPLKQPAVHEWYEEKRPGAALLGTSNIQNETTVASLPRGHYRAQRHVFKIRPPCPNCDVTQNTLDHT
ncbi:hypothetical protein TNCV_333561 [Trichonephila clavipes]|nr:hypothetical protein TNCV_333561 [Trichonephila clavipes]